MPLRLIYYNISKLIEIPGHEVSVRYKMGHFRYSLIHDKILGIACIYFHFFLTEPIVSNAF